MIDGIDLRSYNVAHVRRSISVVSQEPVLFDASIRDNIAYGLDQPCTEEDIIKAAQMANIHPFIMSLPQVGHPCDFHNPLVLFLPFSSSRDFFWRSATTRRWGKEERNCPAAKSNESPSPGL